MNFLRITAILLLCFLSTGLVAQKKLIKKANDLYKQKQYTNAIELYEQALQQTENLAASTKLANAYRMTNQTEKAEALYSDIVENEKAKPITYYHYAESLMSNGKYDLAKNWFLKYNEKDPGNQDAIRMAYACDRVKTLEPYFPNIDIQAFEHNSDADDGAPVAFNGGMVFTSDRAKSGMNPLKQKSGWTGRDYQRIYFSSKEANGNYSPPGNFSKKLNELNMHCGPVTISADKQLAIFSRTAATPDKNNTYNIQLYSAVSEDGNKWKKVELLPFCKPDKNYMHPALSPDGTKLFFVSDKGGGIGGTDIYLSEKKGDQWGKPKNLGPVINTPSNEAFPYFHESGKLFFASKGHLSFGGYDLLFSNLKEDNSWQKPVNVGQPINSSQDDISIFLDSDMTAGFFVSSRSGGDDDIYTFTVLEGVNANLEEIDFDEASSEGPEIERIEVPINTSPSGTLADEQPQMGTDIENETTQLKEEVIRSTTDAMEKPRETTEVAINHSPVSSSAEINLPSETTTVPEQDIEIVSENAPKEEIIEEAESVSAGTNLMIREKVTPSASTQVIPESPTNIVVEEEIEIAEVNTPSNETAAANTNKKSVNLMIPSKKTVQNPGSAASQKEEVEELIEVPSEGFDPIEESEDFSDEIEEVVPPVEDTSLPSNEEIISEHTEILDREMPESAPPVLLNEDKSMISDSKPESTTQLAELLQTGQTVPASGFKIDGVNYSTGSFLLTPESTKSLAAVIDLLNMYPDLKVEIGSHTSSIGSDIENHNLSTKRAMAIKAYLVYKGVTGDRIDAKGYGETKLVNTCSNGKQCTPEKHAENDRVEIRVK